MSTHISNLGQLSEVINLPQSRRRHVKPARVLHLIEATLGGTLAYLDTMITASVGLPFQFGLAYSTVRATPALEAVLDKARAHNWQTFQIDMAREVSARTDFRSMLRILALYGRFEPTIVHCHSSKAGALGRVAGLLSFPHGPRVVYTPHAVAVHLGRRYLLAEKVLAPLTACMIPVTEGEADQLISLRLTSSGHYHVMLPVVECSQFLVRDRAQARLELGLPPEVPIIMSVGRLTAQKGPLTFLLIVKQVLKSFPAARGIWVGAGELQQEFLRLAGELGIADRVMVTGWQDDVQPWLAASDLLLSTSKYESFGYMVAEALAMERPVVATSITGTRDIMLGELSAYLYPPGDAVKAGQLIGKVLGDPVLAASLGKLGRRTVAVKFSASEMHRSMHSLYTTLSSESKSRVPS